jgi:putative aminopeptidase FrvX
LRTHDHPAPHPNPVRRFGVAYFCECDMNDETLKLDIIKAGGYAYPHFPYTIGGNPQINGMTLRDRFALAVVQGWVATFVSDGLPNEVYAAALGYRIADAMLAERVK